MSKSLKSLIQICVSLALGIGLIWLVFKDLTPENLENLAQAFKRANYGWIMLSLALALIGHWLRAYRWKYPMEALGMKMGAGSRFAAVMVGYLANLALPRLGEISRCAVATRYEGHPFEKVFGTVMAERLVDAVLLLVIIAISIAIQVDVLGGMLLGYISPMLNSAGEKALLVVLFLGGVLFMLVIWRYLIRSNHKYALLFREKLRGFLAGLATLRHMPGMGWFYLHTLAIWLSYIVMFYVGFECLPELYDVPLKGKLAAFSLGGLSIVAVQGGLGAYPAAIMVILMLYNVDKEPAYAFGWIMWAGQTIMILLVGFLSLIALPFLPSNRARND